MGKRRRNRLRKADLWKRANESRVNYYTRIFDDDEEKLHEHIARTWL